MYGSRVWEQKQKMQRFFLSRTGHIDGEHILITGDDARHIAKSLRMAVSDTVIVCDMQKNEYRCEIERFEDENVVLKIVGTGKNDTEPTYRAHLYQALPKGDKFDTVVQKAVELGVWRIVPFVSERCIAREVGANKLTRWRRIAKEAATQCGRGAVPEVTEPVSYREALAECSRQSPGFLCYEGDGTLPLGRVLSRCAPDGEIGFLIGSEGGFSLKEVEEAESFGLWKAGLGKRILRCETASGFVLSALVYRLELGEGEDRAALHDA